MSEPNPGVWCTEPVQHSALLVDGEAYFRTLFRGLSGAQHSILITGWQFDPQVQLLRGEAARDAELPVQLWGLLNALCDRRPQLSVFVLAWDYSLVYAFERDWMQMAQARIAAHHRIKFRWHAHPDPLGSHHRKFVVVDGELAFAGGIDLGMARWDTPEHLPKNPLRAEGELTSEKPFHDIQAAVQGPVVARLEELFWEAWQQSGGEPAGIRRAHEAGEQKVVGSVRTPEPRPQLPDLCGEQAWLIPAGQVSLSRTSPPTKGKPAVRETLAMYERLLASAERLIYIETQYFTSSAVSRALLSRMSQRDMPALEIVFVMPEAADSPKEQFALGKRQDQVLAAIESGAQQFGHAFRILHSVTHDEQLGATTTFIHSKLMIVDDEVLVIGSANLTNRSMGLDSELVLTFNADRSESLAETLGPIRASLLAEHAGLIASDRFQRGDGLIECIDELCAGESKLVRREVTAADTADPLILALFDPTTSLEFQDWDRIWEEALGLDEQGVLKRSWDALKNLLSTA